jgi:hypothetical protein
MKLIDDDVSWIHAYVPVTTFLPNMWLPVIYGKTISYTLGDYVVTQMSSELGQLEATFIKRIVLGSITDKIVNERRR